jgi:hypothetical protein
VAAVSFAAAALLLLHDLAMRNLEEAGYEDLETYIIGLAEIVDELIEGLAKSTSKLENLLAPRPAGRSPDPGAKHYTALVLYRMGRDLKAIARRIGINPRTERDGEEGGSKNWKTLLLSSIQSGIEVEKETFSLATAVFALRSDERAQKLATNIYHDYYWTFNEALSTNHVDWMDEGDDFLNIPTNGEEQIYRAYVQLGSCHEKGLNPFPTTVKELYRS